MTVSMLLLAQSVKNLPASAGDAGSISGSERSSGEGNGSPLQYSCLGIPWREEPGGLQSMDCRSWEQRLNHHSLRPSLFSRVRVFVTPWITAHQAPLSMGFSKREHWSGFPCPLPGDLRDPGIESTFLIFPALTPIRTWYNLDKFNLHCV